LTAFSGPFEAYRAVEFARQSVRGPVAFFYNHPKKGTQTVSDGPVFTILPENAVIESVLPEASDEGILLRIREISGRVCNAKLGIAERFSRVFVQDGGNGRSVELESANGICSFKIKARQCLTLRVEKSR